ncbi:MAG: hypothetical protein H0X65_03210 [Gemmatimonadetes bacterium]|nr:hypothetical protein [Gemmatimonadota bacterium]
MNRWMVWLVPASVLSAFLSGAWGVGRLLQLTGRDLWILRGGLGMLGLLAALLLFLYLRPRLRARPKADSAEKIAEREVDAAIAAARKHLTASGAMRSARLGKLPVVLMLGPSGSTKTSSVVHSGLEPELLAGEVYRGDTVVPTTGLNLWYAQETIFLEAGSRLLEEPTRWKRLLRHIQPRRLGAVFSRGAQAPRVAVVCVSCDEFLKPGSSESLPALARKLRARLGEVAQQLGIQLPVYVLFTKADRLPYFADYVRNLSREEAQEVLGATLPMRSGVVPATFTEQESARLTEAFREIIHSLSLRRLDLLPREASEEVRAGAYEFPRELRKLTDLGVHFLVELCKPSQLGVSPFLRGFYFTGVRAVIVSDAAAAELPAPGPVGSQVALGATNVFDVRQLQVALHNAPSRGGSRKVPEWLFLKRVFREVILRDRSAARITGGGTRVNYLRRAALGAAVGFFLFLSAGFTLSYANNRALERDALAAARGIEALGAREVELPALEMLHRLDALRAQVERVERYERRRRPLGFRWGLYTGAELEPELRRLYFDRFERLLWGGARTELLGALERVPAAPAATGDFSRTYDALKAHLITTSQFRRSDAGFLTPVLLDYSTPSRQLDAERLELVRRQFDFFGSELRFGNPYRDGPVEPLVRQTRSFLCNSADANQFYQMLVLDAFRNESGVQFSQLVPGSEVTVRNPYVVPWQFTKPGWQAVQAKLSDVDQLFGDEEWVVGEGCVGVEDRAKLVQALRTRYLQDYVQHWQSFLKAAGVVGIDAPATAVSTLGRLSSSQSPLFRMFSLVSQNTDVDPSVARAFAPVHTLVPPDSAESYIGSGPSQAYVGKLAGLQAEIGNVVGGSTPEMRQLAMLQASNRAGEVRTTVAEIARGFPTDGGAPVAGQEAQRLLLQPVGNTEAALRGVPAADANKAGESFCGQFNRVTAGFPFRSGGRDAALDEVIGLFQPDAGVLWQAESALPNLVMRQGATGFARHPSANPAPSGAFIGFLNAGARVSRGLFMGAEPKVNFYLRLEAPEGASGVTFNLDGHTRSFTPTRNVSLFPFTWDGRSAQQVRITFEGTDLPPLERQGTWAIFRLFRDARWQAQPDGGYRVEWTIPGAAAPLRGEVKFDPGAPAVFRPQFFDGLTCPGRIVG